jgi:ATP-dependent DNA ligase
MKETVMLEDYSRKVYKLDSKGKVRVLHVYTDGADLIQESGLLDGKLTEHRNTCVAKNVGKSNETTAEEQARKEAASKIETKMSTGYFDTVAEAKANVVKMPMLAKSYKNEKNKVDWDNAYVQPKLDGMRAHAGTDLGKVMSRKGKEVDTVQHILDDIQEHVYDSYTYDGELYAHGLSFQENMKLLKKYREGETEEVIFHVYDVVYESAAFIDRYTHLKSALKHCKHVNVVPTYKVNNEEELQMYHERFLSMGYEGTMLRWGNAGYKPGSRSSNLLKYKDFIDIAAKVVDVKPCSKRPHHGECVCEYNGKTFGTGMKFSHAEREEILKNKDEYIGQTAEIRFFEWTDDGKPRFPVCVGFRLDK